MGPSGFLPSASDPALGNITYEELVDVFREQATGLIAGGVDVLLIETSQDLLEVKAAITGCRAAIDQCSRHWAPGTSRGDGSSADLQRGVGKGLAPSAQSLAPSAQSLAPRVALQVQVTLDPSGRMLLGTDIAAAATVLDALRADVIGLNCSTGPDHMRQPVRWLCENTTLPISVIPNAGIPHNEGGQAVYPLSAEALADAHDEFVLKYGVNVVGGCCGTTPEHLRAVVERVWGRKPAARDVVRVPRLASAITAFDIHQEPAPTIVGERVNSQGSRAVKRALIDDDYDAVLEVARGQQDGGAHLLDVCVALTERSDEAAQMRRLVKLLAQSVETPLVIDSTEADAVAAALRQYPGRAVINSINMENGRKRIEAVVPHAVEHGAALVAMTIDETGMAKTAARKLEVARAIHDIVVGEYGLRADALIFDPLTFTLATGEQEFRRSAIETIEGVRAIKQGLPGVFTVLGVSNVSFGLQKNARAVLNSVFLHHCVEAGLDCAIVHPSHVKPYAEIDPEQRALADELIFDRSDDALAKFIQFYEGRSSEEEEVADPTEGMTPDQALHWKILHRKKEGIEDVVDAAIALRLATGRTGAGASAGAGAGEDEGEVGQTTASSGDQAGPAVSADLTSPHLTSPSPTPTPESHLAGVNLLNTVLLPAMKEVGDKFGAGELILPFVLQSAEAMKRAVARMEQYLEKVEGQSKGIVVLATVHGDVHDIGKNLVHTIVANNGYTVHDLGKQVPMNVIIDKAIEVKADVVGLSALLVSTSKQMPAIVQELHRRGLEFPVMCGGAAINPSFIRTAAVVGPASGPGSGAGADGADAATVATDDVYQPGVWYCKDAFEGLAVVDTLRSPKKDEFVAKRNVEIVEGIAKRIELQKRAKASRPVRATGGPSRDVPIPAPEFLGVKVLDRLPLADLYRLIDLNTLYRLHWGAKNAKGEEFDRLVKKEFEPRLKRYKREALAGGRVRVRAAYGFWPALADGNDLVLFDPEEHEREVGRFPFPRQADGEHLCLADYFRPAPENGSPESGIRNPESTKDVVGLQLVTVGDDLLIESERLMKSGDYSEGYFLHGFGVRLAEAAAEYVHRRMRKELGIGGNQGQRYSWGYPACPDHQGHEVVFDLLPARERLGMELTEGWSLVPELSTAALVVHHPEAKYFSAVSGAEAPGSRPQALANATAGRRDVEPAASKKPGEGGEGTRAQSLKPRASA
ncbi:MAG TPA: homocysteine S-methyltransferase family protein, partial [Longimicrobiales bacterium]|nr:homocysteine S-methyltransferase family protein [Longimicrobiales bacterium]